LKAEVMTVIIFKTTTMRLRKYLTTKTTFLE